MARVEDIQRIWVELPYKPVPGRNVLREIPHWNLFELCLVTLDSGQVGIGETMVYYTYNAVTDAAVQRVLGKNPTELMWDDTLGAGLQMALLDAVGKLLEAPVCQLFGQQVRRRAHVGWWAIDMPADDWIAECREAMAAGYTSFKTKARPWFDLEDQVEKLCSAVPDWFKIDLDFNDFGLDPTIAVPLCKRLQQWPQIAIWESPIRQEDLAGVRHLRQRLDVAIAHHANRPALDLQIREDCCDGFVIEGGVSHALQHATVCAQFNKPFWLQWVGTNLTALFTLHLQAVMTHARWPGIQCNHMYAAQVVREPWQVDNGLAAVPAGPGIGATLDWDVVERYRIEPKEKPYPYPGLLLRLDWPSGSATYFAHAAQMWEEFSASRLPAFLRGVNLTRIEDDGSAQWRELYQRACQGPVSVDRG